VAQEVEDIEHMPHAPLPEGEPIEPNPSAEETKVIEEKS